MPPTRARRPTRGRGSPAGATPARRAGFPPTIGPWPPMKETGPPPPPPPTELTALRVAHCSRARWQPAGLFPHAKGLSWKPGAHSELLLPTLSSKFENIAPCNASSKRHFLVPETPIPNLPQSPPQLCGNRQLTFPKNPAKAAGWGGEMRPEILSRHFTAFQKKKSLKKKKKTFGVNFKFPNLPPNRPAASLFFFFFKVRLHCVSPPRKARGSRQRKGKKPTLRVPPLLPAASPTFSDSFIKIFRQKKNKNGSLAYF